MSGPCRCLYPRRAPVAPVVAVPCALARMRARAPGRPGDSNGESAGRAEDQLERRHPRAAFRRTAGKSRRTGRTRTRRLVRGTLPLPAAAAAAAAVFCPLRGPLLRTRLRGPGDGGLPPGVGRGAPRRRASAPRALPGPCTMRVCESPPRRRPAPFACKRTDGGLVLSDGQ